MGGYYATASAKYYMRTFSRIRLFNHSTCRPEDEILCEKMALTFRAYCLWYTSGSISIIEAGAGARGAA